VVLGISRKIRLNLKAIRFLIRDLLKRYGYDIKRIISEEDFSKYMFEQIKELRKLIFEDYHLYKLSNIEQQILTEEMYIELSSSYIDVMSEYLTMMFENADINSSKIHKSANIISLYLYSLEYNDHPKLFKKVVDEIVKNGYISYQTWKELNSIKNVSPLADFFLKYLDTEYGKTERELMSEVLYLIRRAYELSEGLKYNPSVSDTDIISKYYKKGDVEDVIALKNYLVEQFFNEYYPLPVIDMSLFTGNIEYVSIIARYQENVISRGKKTKHRTLTDSNSLGLQTISELCLQMKQDFESGMTYTDIVRKYFPDKADAEVSMIIIRIKKGE